MSERGEALSCEREITTVEIIFSIFGGFTTTIGAHSISKEGAGYSPLWFSQGNYLCLLSLMFIVVHVILSVKYPKIIMLA